MQKKTKKVWSKTSESSTSSGQHRIAQQEFFNRNHSPGPSLPEKPNKSRPVLPIQDPPWLKKASDQVDGNRLNKSCTLPPSQKLPSRDAPWVKNRTPSDQTNGRLNKPCPLPMQDPPWLRNKILSDKTDSDNRLSKSYPSPLPKDPPRAEKKTPFNQMDDRLNKPLPVPPPIPKKAGKSKDKRFISFDESPPPPLPPERGSSHRDMFEETPLKLPNKSKQPPMGKKPCPLPTKAKPVLVPQNDEDDDFDFPTAAEYKKSQAVPSSVSSQPPSLPPRVPSTPRYRDPIDDRPPVPPPKSTGRYYH